MAQMESIQETGKQMGGDSLAWWIDLVSRAYLWAVILAAVAAVAIAVTSWFVIKWQADLQREKDAAFEKYMVDAAVEVATLTKQAAALNLELERIKAPRSLDASQQTRMVEQLKPFAGQEYSFNVFPDPEPISLMQIIDNVLKNAGWVRIRSQLGDIETQGAGHATDTGLQIGIKPTSDNALRNLAILLASMFTTEGIPAVAAQIAELKNDKVININVGKKPVNVP
jgi:hypothetical protein